MKQGMSQVKDRLDKFEAGSLYKYNYEFAMTMLKLVYREVQYTNGNKDNTTGKLKIISLY